MAVSPDGRRVAIEAVNSEGTTQIWVRSLESLDAQPLPGTFGDLEYRAVEGPGYWTIDVGLSRLIQIGGTQNLEIRLESFNVTNNFNWGNPAVNLNQAQFGRITTNGGAPRIIQFGIKYAF